MEYYFNEEGKCLVVDLREVNADDRYRFENVLDKYKFLEKESYEDNLYHIYLNTESDWEDMKTLTIDLDDVDIEIFVEDVEDSLEDNDYEDYSLEELDYL